MLNTARPFNLALDSPMSVAIVVIACGVQFPYVPQTFVLMIPPTAIRAAFGVPVF